MDIFSIQKNKYFAAVDFGSKQDMAVMTVVKQNENGIIEVVSLEHLGKSENWDEMKKEEYKKYLNVLLDLLPKRTKIGELQTLEDNESRDILQLLKNGDYIIGYNGCQGLIVETNHPYYLTVEYNNIKRNIHVCNVKQFIFN